ncbi:uncharacterized protein LACBIDRAFT_316305 [Laccaria bicolor S238N-H82]|uniref:Predicted protein n=1 Tax=Laccaria bicolor (strain S238N-H82 / ATCC MYA-4686) TaxID=486041 RepID=B0E0N9_LACBS|nr:uncharacterized protein LACBIDRAFT_316305 [Laccaria bicolor S238N-H82]EDQ99619.1 predicted protein [Laccaria bicolor S238N-H82]|eukprot:XP_001889730.1 predicted protein [Laccaria bicolor S238N-H82]
MTADNIINSMSSSQAEVEVKQIDGETEVQRGEESKIAIPSDHAAGARAADPGILEEIAKEYQTKEPFGAAQETLGWLYYLRFMAVSDVSAIQKAIVHFQAAIDGADDKHPDLPRRQHSLAVAYNLFYKGTGLFTCLNLSIHWLQLAIDDCHSDSPDLPIWYQNLAVLYFEHYKHEKNMDDLELAINFDSSALEMISSGHPGFVKFFEGLAQSYCSRFDRLGEVEDLNKGIEVLQGAVRASLRDHPDLPEAWRTLSVLYINRFRIKGSKEDFETAISLRKLAVQATSPGTTEHITYMQSLAAAYGEWYKSFSSFEDLELSIKYVREAILQAPTEEPIYATLLGDLGVALMYKYKTRGGDENVKLALRYLEFSVKSLPAGDEKIPHSQKNLALAYLQRYRNEGNIEDLKQAQDHLKQALGAIQPTDPLLYGFHDSLAAAYLLYFDQFGDLHYISLALDQYKLAVAFISPTSMELSHCEHNIANCYASRYKRLHDHDDLDLAIQYSMQLLQHMSTNHQDISTAKSILSSLLHDKFKLQNEVADLDSAMKLEREALDAVGETNPSQPKLLHDLAFLHLAYFEYTKDITHLEAAIPLMEKCLEMAHETDLDSPVYHHTLAVMLGKLWMVDGKIDWIYTCIKVCAIAINHARTDESILPMLYHLIDKSFSIICIHSQAPNNVSVSQEVSAVEDAYCALYYYRASLTSSFATPKGCLEAALDWAEFATILNLNETLTAYSFALATLPNILWIGNSLGDRYNSLVKLNISGLVSSAVAAALKFNDVKHAVELIEQGLAITYQQMLELRDEPTQLIKKYPEIGLELKQISMKLQEISDPKRTIKQDYHSLVIRQKDLMHKIRTLPGFENFSCQNYTKNYLKQQSMDYCEKLKKALGFHNISAREINRPEKERSGRPSHSRSADLSLKYFRELLSWLWKAIVKLVLDVLESNGIHSGRMWCCPSGPFTFLPIHAAASNSLFIQSYTPTLNASIEARTPKATTTNSISLATIGITDIPGKPYLKLPSVTKELNSIKEVIASANILSDAEATVSNVLETMGNHEWLHIACHGEQDINLPRAQFAFLSACQTAMGSSDLPNESLHLAGGFIVAGCQATIGTLWNMEDSDGPKVAELVY